MRLCALLIAAVCLWALPAAAQQAQPAPNPFLAQARIFYQGLEFERCLQRLDLAGQRETSLPEQAEIELYKGLCHYHLDEVAPAKEHFARAVALDASVELPPFTSPKIIAVFDEVRARAAPSPSDAPRQNALTPPPRAPPSNGLDLTASQPPRRSYVAPLSFAGGAVLAGSAAVLFGAQARSLEQAANAAHFESDAFRLGAQARQRALFANVSIGVAVAAASGALVTLLFPGERAPEESP